MTQAPENTPSSSSPKVSAEAVADFLMHHPDFFEQHAAVFAQLRLPHDAGGNTVSLIERQVRLLRAQAEQSQTTLRVLTQRAQDNQLIVDQLFQWLRGLLAERQTARLPDQLTLGLRRVFDLPQAVLRLWDLDPAFTSAGQAWAAPLNAAQRAAAERMSAPSCGPAQGNELERWFEPPLASVAWVPLRVPGTSRLFGMLGLGSPDPERYAAGLQTDFLTRLGELSAAALSRLLPLNSGMDGGVATLACADAPSADADLPV